MLGPELAKALDPVGGVAQRLGDEAQPVLAAVPAAAQQAGLFQHTDVLRDGGQRQGERGGYRRDGRLAVAEADQDRPPRRVGQGEE